MRVYVPGSSTALGANSVVSAGSGSSPLVICNGFTNAAITAAIALLPTISHPILGSIQWGTVILPHGVYAFTGSVTVPSYVTLDGLRRAILTRSGGYTGLFFTNASAVAQFALNGMIWDNGATANQMFQFPVGCVGFDMLWARFQNTNGPVGQFVGCQSSSATISSDLTFEDIRLIGTGTIANQPGLILNDVSDVVCKNFKTYPDTGQTQALNAVKIETTGNCTTPSRNIRVEGVEAEHCNETVVLIRNNGSGVMENVTVKSIVGEHIGSATTQKGLVDVGEQVGGSALSSWMHGIRVEDIDGRDWYGHLVNIGGGAQNGDVADFTVTGVRGDSKNYSTGTVDTTKVNTCLNIVGCYDGTIDGVVARNTGSAGVRFANGVGAVYCSNIEGTNIDVESCVQNPNLTSPSTWQIGGIFLDYGCSKIRLKGRSANNYSSANPGGNSLGAGVAALTGAAAQCNDITLDVVCEDTRGGGSQFQDLGVRIGQSDSDGNQPNRWTINTDVLRGNGVGPYKQFGSTNHGHNLAGHAPKREAVDQARNVISETMPFLAAAQGASTSSTLTSGTMIGALVGFRAGDVITGIEMGVVGAGSTGSCTLAKVGILDQAGNLVASSADFHASWPASAQMLATNLSSAYTVPLTGSYYLVHLNVFTFTTVPQLLRGGVYSGFGIAINSGKLYTVLQSGLSDLPNPATLAAGTVGWWLAAY